MGISVGPAIIHGTVAGNNGIGGCSAPGLKIGDILMWALMSGNSSVLSGNQELEAVVTVDDQIQQIDAADLSSHVFTVVLIRPGA